jgi:hypothetical protein
MITGATISARTVISVINNRIEALHPRPRSPLEGAAYEHQRASDPGASDSGPGRPGRHRRRPAPAAPPRTTTPQQDLLRGIWRRTRSSSSCSGSAPRWR